MNSFGTSSRKAKAGEKFWRYKNIYIDTQPCIVFAEEWAFEHNHLIQIWYLPI